MQSSAVSSVLTSEHTQGSGPAANATQYINRSLYFVERFVGWQNSSPSAYSVRKTVDAIG